MLQAGHQKSTKENGKVLLLLDANETLLYRKYDPETQTYSAATLRPYLSEFVTWLKGLARVDLGVWMGVYSQNECDTVMELLKPAGLTKKLCRKRVFFAFAQFKQRGKNRCFKGTTKPIITKPVRMMKQIFPTYSHVLLFDNDVEKSQGLDGKGGKFANTASEHIEVTPFRGDTQLDNELQPSVGAGAKALSNHLSELLPRQ